MTLYESIPQTVEAEHWNGTNAETLIEWASGKVALTPNRPDLMLLAGKEGAQEWVPVPVGHWLVHLPGDLSDVWPVDPGYFAAKYRPVPQETPT